MISTGVESFSLSATHSARFRARSRAYTSSSNHDGWRNSNAAQTRGGNVVEERVEEREILLQIRRQLKQQRAELRTEDRRGLEELPDAIAAVAQPRVVRDPLRRLERQLEALGRRRAPAGRGSSRSARDRTCS